MRRTAGLALTVSALFLIIEAVMINSAALFYMSTAMIMTIGASRLQAYLSVQALEFRRVAPGSATIGERVTVEITVSSLKRIRRPLISVADNLPRRLLVDDLTRSLPIAPSMDTPLTTQYSFVPLRRGHYRWSGLTVYGTDALGLVTMTKEYRTDPADLLILPKPIPVMVELPLSAGWGVDEAETGRARGTGLEPRGVREFVHGDSLRHVHWRSSARANRLLVKEFESGSHITVGFVIQQTQCSDFGDGPMSSFETMCGQVLYLSEAFLRQGARVCLPGLDQDEPSKNENERIQEIARRLAEIECDRPETLSNMLLDLPGALPQGAVLYCLMSTRDDGFVQAAGTLRSMGVNVVALVYSPADYITKSVPQLNSAASDSQYLDHLRASGIVTVLMPKQGGVEEPTMGVRVPERQQVTA